jgi:hypothetical protein
MLVLSNILDDIEKVASGEMSTEEFVKKHGQKPPKK